MSINRIARRGGARALASVTILCLLSWLTPPSFAQTTTATISGIVKDQNGATVADAKVTATNVGTNASRSTNTDSDGRYLILELPVGWVITTFRSNTRAFAKNSAGELC
jgi:hypothetical protein